MITSVTIKASVNTGTLKAQMECQMEIIMGAGTVINVQIAIYEGKLSDLHGMY